MERTTVSKADRKRKRNRKARVAEPKDLLPPELRHLAELSEAPLLLQSDVLQATGLSKNLLDQWIRRGHVFVRDRHPGTGRRRRYSLSDSATLLAMAELARLGMAPNFFRERVAMYVAAGVESRWLVALPPKARRIPRDLVARDRYIIVEPRDDEDGPRIEFVDKVELGAPAAIVIDTQNLAKRLLTAVRDQLPPELRRVLDAMP